MDHILVDSNGCLHQQKKEFSVQFRDQELGAFPIVRHFSQPTQSIIALTKKFCSGKESSGAYACYKLKIVEICHKPNVSKLLLNLLL
jgi:hypothetical protein